MARARRTVLAGVLTLGLVLSLAPGAAAEHYEGTFEVQGATPTEASVSFSRLTFPGGSAEA
ncbi:MAG TPA: hypothetical protein VNU01_08065, partial [Egibacteraceae bacterium]|nr:hypothetical protein [Egibacteraceae bacterium]